MHPVEMSETFVSDVWGQTWFFWMEGACPWFLHASYVFLCIRAKPSETHFDWMQECTSEFVACEHIRGCAFARAPPVRVRGPRQANWLSRAPPLPAQGQRPRSTRRRRATGCCTG